MTDLSALLDQWAAHEATLRDFGAVEAAQAVQRCRKELATWYREHLYEELTLEDAAIYSGLSPGTIGNRLRDGTLPNVGSKGRPRVRRCDLPSKPPGSGDPGEAIDLADKILR